MPGTGLGAGRDQKVNREGCLKAAGAQRSFPGEAAL